MKKINLLYMGKEPLQKRFVDLIYLQVKMPFLCRKIFPLTGFCKSKCQIEPDATIYSLDFRHWYYDRKVFSSYIKTAIVTNPEFVFLLDNPIGFERPWKIDVKDFLTEMSYRASELADRIKDKLPETKIFSPWISNLYHEHRKYYVDFLCQFNSFFDYYSVLCANDMSDASLGALVSDLGTLQGVSKKPVFLMCAIPSGEKISTGTRDLNIKEFVPLSEEQAILKLKQIYDLFSKMCTELYFAYFGIGKDIANNFNVPDNRSFWSGDLPLDLYFYEKKWDWVHFLGIMDWDGRIKFELLKAIIDLGEIKNV